MGNIVIHIVTGKEYRIEGEFVEITQILNKLYGNSSIDNANTNTISLYDIVPKKLPKSEPEWILIYAHFISKDEFSRSDIINSYKNTQRYSYNISKNLTHNLNYCIKKNWVSTTNGTQYSLLPTGKSHIQEILARLI